MKSINVVMIRLCQVMACHELVIMILKGNSMEIYNMIELFEGRVGVKSYDIQ